MHCLSQPLTPKAEQHVGVMERAYEVEDEESWKVLWLVCFDMTRLLYT